MPRIARRKITAPFSNGRPARASLLTDFAAALHPGDSGAYVNFPGDEGPARVRDAYPGATWERLAEIKARYDPTNYFHLNHNILPVKNGDPSCKE